MVHLQPDILALYRVATTKDVRSWSFGVLRAVRIPGAVSWEEKRGSLDDQAIFGPIRDLVCACGKYQGDRYKNMICDRCGVKVASAEIRRSRFGHIDLVSSVPHPLGHADETIETIPILPAVFFASAHDAGLAKLYDNLVRANDSENAADIASAVEQICELLVPIFVQAYNWNLQEADTLARGLGLVRKNGTAENDDRCDTCGYPLGGVTAATCPGCGKRIERE